MRTEPRASLSPQLRKFVEDVLFTLEPRFQQQGICVSAEIPGDAMVAPSRELRIALFQLIRHAADSMPDGGDLLVAAYVDNDALELEVADSGQGGASSGLGSESLDSVRRFAEQIGGTIRLVNCAQGGIARILLIPRERLRAAA